MEIQLGPNLSHTLTGFSLFHLCFSLQINLILSQTGITHTARSRLLRVPMTYLSYLCYWDLVSRSKISRKGSYSPSMVLNWGLGWAIMSGCLSSGTLPWANKVSGSRIWKRMEYTHVNQRARQDRLLFRRRMLFQECETMSLLPSIPT